MLEYQKTESGAVLHQATIIQQEQTGGGGGKEEEQKKVFKLKSMYWPVITCQYPSIPRQMDDPLPLLIHQCYILRLKSDKNIYKW